MVIWLTSKKWDKIKWNEGSTNKVISYKNIYLNMLKSEVMSIMSLNKWLVRIELNQLENVYKC